MDTTIQRVARPRGELTETETDTLALIKRQLDTASAEWRDYCVFLLVDRGRSFSEVSKATGLSTNTLQRWKREAK